MKRCSASEFKR